MKKRELKKVFPIRFSELELRAFKAAAGKEPIRDWMRATLLAAVPVEALAKTGLTEALKQLGRSGAGSIVIDLGTPKPRNVAPEKSESRV